MNEIFAKLFNTASGNQVLLLIDRNTADHAHKVAIVTQVHGMRVNTSMTFTSKEDAVRAFNNFSGDDAKQRVAEVETMITNGLIEEA